MVVDGVLQDALKQHRQFRQRLGGVFFGKPQHRILDDVECGVLVAHGKQRLLEGAAFDLCEKVRNLLVRSYLPSSRRVWRRL